jgi:AcrR family transcriptional regulator
VAKPRFQRRKEDRPAEITEAAMEAFAEQGFAATKVEDVARRAGVSKGLLYLYFKTKEDLFKAVIRSFVSPKVDALTSMVEKTELTAEEFLRGPFLAFAQSVPNSPARILARLMISEGPKHPDLVRWYWENVVSKGLEALRSIIKKGVDNGEFRASALDDFPHILIAPVAFCMLWKILFNQHESLDTDRLIEENLELVLGSIRKT